MGFLGKIVGSNPTNKTQETETLLPPVSLDLEETSYILRSMQNGTFKGNELEKVFNLVMKLQNHYINIEKND